jgi:hypothetical protein
MYLGLNWLSVLTTAEQAPQFRHRIRRLPFAIQKTPFSRTLAYGVEHAAQWRYVR